MGIAIPVREAAQCDLQTTIFNSTFKARYSIPPSLSLSDEVKLRNCELRPIVTCFDNIGSPVVGRGGAQGWRATPARVLPSTKTVPTVVATLSIEMALDRGKLPGPSPPQVRRLTMPVLGSLVFGSKTMASSISRGRFTSGTRPTRQSLVTASLASLTICFVANIPLNNRMTCQIVVSLMKREVLIEGLGDHDRYQVGIPLSRSLGPGM